MVTFREVLLELMDLPGATYSCVADRVSGTLLGEVGASSVAPGVIMEWGGGAAAFLAGWFYTGGPRPYGYAGFGELFVFVFFGLVATVGTTYVQVEKITGLSVAAAIPVGLIATALLVTNNLRDIPTDATAGKRTLAVRLGDRRTRLLYVAIVVVVFAMVVAIAVVDRPWAALALIGVVVAAPPARTVLSGASGRALIPVLGATGRTQLVMGTLLAIGIAVSA